VIHIRLLPDAGSPAEAILRVNCAKGKVPEEEQSDGVRLDITGGPPFDGEVNGHTIFLLRQAWAQFRLEAGTQARGSRQSGIGSRG